MNVDRIRRPLRFGVITIAAVAALAAASAAAACPVAAATGTPASRDAEFALAMAEYEANHWRAAYEGLVRLADQGHAEASRITLLMWHHGPALYGQRFEAPPLKRRQWAAAAGLCQPSAG